MARKARGDVAVTYNSNALTNYCKQADLDATVERLETTHLGSTAKSTIAGDAEWKISLSGDWDNTLDGYLGPDVVTPGTARTASIAFTGASATVTYTWTSAAEIQDFKWGAQVGQAITWSATLALSGAPTRASA
jgi:hypothetical protein